MTQARKWSENHSSLKLPQLFAKAVTCFIRFLEKISGCNLPCTSHWRQGHFNESKMKPRKTIRTWNPRKEHKKSKLARRVQYFSKLISTKRQKDKNEGRRIGTESFHNWQLYANTSHVLFGFGKCFKLHPRFTSHWSLKRYPRIKRTSSEDQ